MNANRVDFETAALLKCAGYPQCKKEDGYAGWKYNLDGELTTSPFANHFAAPMQYNVMEWFRNEHNIHICLLPYDIDYLAKKGYGVRYLPEIYTMPKIGHELECKELDVCDTFEEACTDAIRKSAKILISRIKEEKEKSEK